MARTAFTVQTSDRAGIVPTFTAFTAVDGFGVPNPSENVILHFRNTNASPRTVTIVTQPTVDGAAIPDKTYNVPATTGEVVCGPFPAAIYNLAYDSESTVYNALLVSCDAFAGLSMAAYKIGSLG